MASVPVQTKPAAEIPALTPDSVLSALQRMEDIEGGLVLLSAAFGNPQSLMDRLDASYSPEDWLRSLVEESFRSRTLQSWRAVIHALDHAVEISAANSIMSFAEPLAGPNLITEEKVRSVMKKVVGDWKAMFRRGWSWLYIPHARMNAICGQYSSDEEKLSGVVRYWVNVSPLASWQALASTLFYYEQSLALEIVKQYLPTERDPSLTTETLVEVLGETERLWFQLGKTLGVTDRVRKQLRHLRVTNHERLVLCLDEWVHTHPCPSWSGVVRALQLMAQHHYPALGPLAVSIRDKYVKASEQSKKLFQRAMEEGYVRVTEHNVLFLGIAGSGKTHMMSLMLEEDPPEERTSTPCAERPVRAVINIRAQKKQSKWHRASQVKQAQVLATAALSSCTNLEGFPKPRSSTEAMANQSPMLPLTNGKGKDKVKQPSPRPPRQPPVQATATTVPPKADIGHEIARMMDDFPYLCDNEVCWVNLIDSGGQPEFHEVLPTFIRKRSACIFVHNASEPLDLEPMVEYYEKDQELGSYRSPLSNLDTLRHCMQSMQSTFSDGEFPLFAFVGTHKDYQEYCPLTLARNKKMLADILADSKDKKFNILYNDESFDEHLFFFNAKKPGPDDKQLAGELCKKIVEKSPAECKLIPQQYYALEQALQGMMEEDGRGVFSKAKIQAVAGTLSFSDESLEAALEYLDQLNIIFYYKAILPNVVFCTSQVLLSTISELVQLCYQLRQNPAAKMSDSKMKRFRDQGIVTLKLLSEERFSTHYIPDLFGPEELILLFEKLFLMARVSKDEYLVPCILPVPQVTKDIPSSVPPLLLFFPDGGPRLGVFCGLIAYLLSVASWKLLTDNKSPITRSNVTFALPTGLPGQVTVSDPLSSYFQVSIETCFDDSLPDVCPVIRATILRGIRTTISSLHYSHSEPNDAFFCSQDCTSSPRAHPATVAPGSSLKYLTCTVNPRKGCKVTGTESVWFPKTAAQDIPVLPELIDFPGKTRRINVAEEIGLWYISVGTALLNDITGAIVPAIVRKCMGDPLEINMEILRRWIQGSGVKDCTWQKLVEVLRKTNLSRLADEIVEVKGK